MALGTGETIAVTIVMLGNISAWVKMIYDARKANANGNGNGNGKLKECPVHSDLVGRMSAVETTKEELSASLDKLHKENREDHQKLFEDNKNLSIAVAQAAAAAAQAATTAAESAKFNTLRAVRKR